MTIASVALAALALLILLTYPLALATGRAPLIAAAVCLVTAALLMVSRSRKKSQIDGLSPR